MRYLARVRHVLSGLWPGGAVLSKAARPKNVAPVSLAGSYPPAAGLTLAMAVRSQTNEHHHVHHHHRGGFAPSSASARPTAAQGRRHREAYCQAPTEG